MLIEAAQQFPTVVFTIGLGICLIYWLFVLIGALDIDLFGDADVSGAGKAIGDVAGAGKGIGGGRGAGEAWGRARRLLVGWWGCGGGGKGGGGGGGAGKGRGRGGGSGKGGGDSPGGPP